MLLYKLRGFNDLDKLLDILLMERLYCAKYQDLNDPFEAMFHVHIPALNNCGFLKPRPARKKTTSIIEHYKDLPEQRVCSLSHDVSDVRLWSFYAEGHTGVAVEIDFSGHENEACEVLYNPELLVEGMSVLESQSPKNILSNKTDHWSYESEYRIIEDQEYYPVAGRIKRIIAGPLANEQELELLRRAVPKIPVVEACLNPDTVTVIFPPNEELDSKCP